MTAPADGARISGPIIAVTVTRSGSPPIQDLLVYSLDGAQVFRTGILSTTLSIPVCIADFNPAVQKAMLVRIVIVPPQQGFGSNAAAGCELLLVVFVDQVEMGVKKAVNLFSQAYSVAPAATTVALYAECRALA